MLKATAEIEAIINPAVLRVPECGKCTSCIDDSSRKLCERRLEVRNKLIAAETKRLKDSQAKGQKAKKRKHQKSPSKDAKSNGSATKKDSGPSKKKKIKISNDGVVKPRVTSQGNKRMSIPDELFPEFCRRIGAQGTGERMKLINKFAEDYPSISVRQVTMKFGEITTRDVPGCVSPPEKKSGRAFLFFLRPKFYHELPEDERPEGWEKYAKEDELLWKEEKIAKKKEKAKRDQLVKDMMEDTASKSQISETESRDLISPFPTGGSSVDGGDETEDEAEPVQKKIKSDM